MLFKFSISLLGFFFFLTIIILSVTEISILKISCWSIMLLTMPGQFTWVSFSNKAKMRYPGRLPAHAFECQPPPASAVFRVGSLLALKRDSQVQSAPEVFLNDFFFLVAQWETVQWFCPKAITPCESRRTLRTCPPSYSAPPQP